MQVADWVRRWATYVTAEGLTRVAYIDRRVSSQAGETGCDSQLGVSFNF